MYRYQLLERPPHFLDDLRFKQCGVDKVTGKGVVHFVDVNPTPVKPIKKSLLASKAGADDPKLVSDCGDLLEKMCALEPEKRIQVRACLDHPFIREKAGGGS